MTNKTVTMSRELIEEVVAQLDDFITGDVLDRLKSALAASVVERQPEPEAFMYQHDETGQIGFVDIQQVEWGFEKNNPRLKIICPLYRSPPAPVAVVMPSIQDDGVEGRGYNKALIDCAYAIEAAAVPFVNDPRFKNESI